MPRARLSPDPPDGLVYHPELLTAEEERALLDEIEQLDFQEIVMKGVVARRTAVRYGLGYDYDRRVPTEGAAPIPEWLVPVRDRAAGLADVGGDELVQALVQRYPEGAPIGWHRDSPAYELVAGISLLAPARLRLRRGSGEERVQWEVPLEPRSGYVLAGPARWTWEHHVPPAKNLRYSITFRSLRATP
ncbi:MAG TPA: alpha-ketoglutarate-dependent dioxygenase AlkB [Gaiellaceae bacterium]|jgi:alkylated DNA repair dioxygenase AlkB|nr:alpha-ketoglutarate-dependent dioxygenase AlkB [Gaiellaceae bacterium]